MNHYDDSTSAGSQSMITIFMVMGTVILLIAAGGVFFLLLRTTAATAPAMAPVAPTTWTVTMTAPPSSLAVQSSISSAESLKAAPLPPEDSAR